MNYDTTLFIANIASVASADSELHPLELAQFELIKKHFKFSKTDWSKGEKKAQIQLQQGRLPIRCRILK